MGNYVWLANCSSDHVDSLSSLQSSRREVEGWNSGSMNWISVAIEAINVARVFRMQWSSAGLKVIWYLRGRGLAWIESLRSGRLVLGVQPLPWECKKYRPSVSEITTFQRDMLKQLSSLISIRTLNILRQHSPIPIQKLPIWKCTQWNWTWAVIPCRSSCNMQQAWFRNVEWTILEHRSTTRLCQPRCQRLLFRDSAQYTWR